MTLQIEHFNLQRIADEVGGRLDGDGELRVTAVSTDTRTIAPGELFIALTGDRFDGHDYVATAAESGAVAALVSESLAELDIPQIVVDDTLVALQQLAAALFGVLQGNGVRSIALTGSNGKTTTKELIAGLWRARRRVDATRGNLNNHIGVPLTLCATSDDTEALVVEMGANAPGDISELIGLAPADVRVITSIGHAHIEGFGGLAGVRSAKSEIFQRSAHETVAVVPKSEQQHLALADFPGRILTTGPHDTGADVEYEQRVPGRVTLRGPRFEYDLRFSLPGAHNAHNLATSIAAIMAADELGTEAELQQALDQVRLPGGRWREVTRGRWRFLDDAYNANPSSVAASWQALVEIVRADDSVSHSGVVAIVGEMLELGPEAERLHCDTARTIAALGGAGAFAFVGTFADAMARAARETTDAEVVAFDDPEATALWLASKTPQLVFIKASRGQKLERIIELVPD